MAQADAHFVDSAINPSNPSSGSNLAYPIGLSHLEGETVAVLGDGAYLGTEAVSSGAIALDDNTTTNHVGLGYNSTIKPMKLDIEQLGIATTKRIAKAILSFYNTLGGQYGRTTSNMKTMPFRETSDAYDSAPSLFSGIKELNFPGGYEREGDIIIRQTQPLPMIVRGAILVLGVHE